MYLNSGDWIENLTSLEYNNNEWNIYQYHDAEFANNPSTNQNKKLPMLNVVTDEVQMFTLLEGIAANGEGFAGLLKKITSNR